MLKLVPNSLITLLQPGPNSQNIINRAAAFDAAVIAGFNPQAYYNLFLQGANLGASINQLTGEIHSAVDRTALSDTRHVREAALDRLRGGLVATGGGKGAATTQDRDGRATTLWGRAVGSWGSSDFDGNGAQLDTNAKGVLVGVDAQFEAVTLGALFNYIHSDVDTAILGNAKVETTGGAVYAGYRSDNGLALAVGGGVSSVRSRTTRTITVPQLGQTLAAHTSGTSYQAFGEVSFDLGATPNARVEPFARFAYVGFDADAFSETGGFATVFAGQQKFDATFTTVGLRGRASVGNGVELRASAGYQRTGGDRAPAALLSLAGTNNFAAIRAVPLDKDAFAGEAGLDVRLGRNATLGASYTGVLGKRVSDNGIKATLTIGF